MPIGQKPAFARKSGIRYVDPMLSLPPIISAKGTESPMIMDIDRVIRRYGQFEQRVRQWTETRCRPYCSVCRHVCCRTHYCLETRQSAFLAGVVQRFPPQSVFSHTHGWLGRRGCTLVAGRPPVCYEFICRPIVDGVAGDPSRLHALLVASMVVTHVGKKAFGGRHVVEITDPADLARIDPERFLRRLDRAEAAFDLAADLLDGRRTSRRLDLLSCIVSPPREKKKQEGD